MEGPTLLTDGDAVEKASWHDLQNLFPHYEVFWRLHLIPLRSEGSIHPRRGIDEDFEFLAMLHYSTYVNVQRALQKLHDASESLRFPDEIYIHLYGAAELAIKVVERFSRIHEECLKQESTVDSRPLGRLRDRFGLYRNLVHEQLPAVRRDPHERLKMPRPDRVETYRKWTDVLYEARPEDFVEVEIQLNNDLRALCSALESAWKQMCELSERLTANKEYLRRREKGTSAKPPLSLAAPPVSGALYSASAVSTVLSPDMILDRETLI